MSSEILTLPTVRDPLPLRKDDDGAIRLGKTRVTLDTIVTAFQEGASADEIVSQYPTLDLADVHAAIWYYLRNRADVETYMRMREKLAQQVRDENERLFDPVGVRNRLLARRRQQQGLP